MQFLDEPFHFASASNERTRTGHGSASTLAFASAGDLAGDLPGAAPTILPVTAALVRRVGSEQRAIAHDVDQPVRRGGNGASVSPKAPRSVSAPVRTARSTTDYSILPPTNALAGSEGDAAP